MTETTILSNAQIVLEDEVIRGHIVMTDGVIAEIGFGNLSDGIECQGHFVCPGLIELRTDDLEPHITPRPNVDWPHHAAIADHDAELAGNGISTVLPVHQAKFPNRFQPASEADD